MKIIRHRVNQVSELATLPPGLGAELDLRSRGDRIILSHDPFTDGDAFDAFAAEWSRRKDPGTLILNPKEDGIEGRLLATLERHALTDYFLLDLPPPAVVRLTCRLGIRKVAVRVSEYESVESALLLRGKAEWAWLDTFSGEPPPRDVVAALQGKFRLCLVSPELHGCPKETIARYLPLAREVEVEAVCTKHPEAWR